MKRLFLIVAAACAAIVSAAALVVSSGAQQPGPPTGTLELVSLDRETRFKFVDNPPRRRESAGDLFMINARLRDGSNRPPADCTHRSPRHSRRPAGSHRDPPPSSSVMVRSSSAARSSIGAATTEPTRSPWWAAPARTPRPAERW